MLRRAFGPGLARRPGIGPHDRLRGHAREVAERQIHLPVIGLDQPLRARAKDSSAQRLQHHAQPVILVLQIDDDADQGFGVSR